MNILFDKNKILKLYIILYILFILFNFNLLNIKFLLSIKSVFFICCIIMLFTKSIDYKLINKILLIFIFLAIGNILYYFLLLISRTYELSWNNFISNILYLISYIYIAFNLFFSKKSKKVIGLALIMYLIIYLGIFIFDIVTKNVINLPLNSIKIITSLSLELIIIWYSYKFTDKKSLVE